MAGETLENGDLAEARDALGTVSATGERMTAVVDDLARLARHGQTVEETRPVEVGRTARAAFEAVAPPDVSLSVDRGGTIEAEPERFQGMFENAVRFAAGTDASGVTGRVGPADGTGPVTPPPARSTARPRR